MADRIFDPGTFTPSAQDFDGGWHTFGVLAELDEPCDLVGGSAWFPSPVPANFAWLVYRVSDEAVIAQVDLAALAGTTAPGWNDFTSADFDTPGDVALDDNETYVVAYATNGDFTYRDSGLAFPYGAGIVTGTEGRFINEGTGPLFPDSGSTAFVFPADMIVDAGGGPTPVAVTAQATGAASATAVVEKKALATGRATGTAAAFATAAKAAASRSTAVASASVAAAKVGAAASAATAAPGATAAVVKVARVTATCTAAAGTSATAASVRPATATATAAAGATATAAKTATATATATGVALARKAGIDIRPVTARCTGIAGTRLRRRRTIQRPNTGTITRPNTGLILRP